MHNHIYSHAELHSYFRKLPLTRILKMNCKSSQNDSNPKDQDLGQVRSEDEEKQKL